MGPEAVWVALPLADLDTGLRKRGLVEGQDCPVQNRFVESRPDRLPTPVEDLVREKVDSIVLAGPAATGECRSRPCARTDRGAVGSC
jgi:hypothetical protein